MKISSHQFVKVVLVSAGLLAVFLAYRADAKKSVSRQNAFSLNVESGIRIDVPLETASDLQPAAPATHIAYPNTGEVLSAGSAEKLEVEEPLLAMEEVLVTKQENLQLEPVSTEIDESVSITNDFVVDDSQESLIETKVEESRPAQPVDYVEQAPQRLEQVPQRVAEPAKVTNTISDAAAQKAVHHIEYGKSLARRNATEAASQEFLGALRVLAESNDAAIGGNDHTRALRSGLLAMKEAADFKVDDPQRQIVTNVGSIIEGHETKIIGRAEAETMTASSATRPVSYTHLTLPTKA